MLELAGIVAGIGCFALLHAARPRRLPRGAAAAACAASLSCWSLAIGWALGSVATLVTLMAAGSVIVIAAPLLARSRSWGVRS